MGRSYGGRLKVYHFTIPSDSPNWGDRLGPHSNVNKLYLVKLPHKKINGGGVIINNKLDVRNSYEIPDS